MDKNKLLILIAPNVGEQMGGEAIKALQIFQEYKKLHPNTIQITHERNRAELDGRLQLADVYYVEDNQLSLFLWKSVIFRLLLNVQFSKQAVALAETIAKHRGFEHQSVIVHQTEPNSPVTPREISKKHINVFGPINGNIYYPKIYQHRESLFEKFRRLLHFPLQRINSIFFRNLTKADLIFVAGGDRTKDSLLAGGCPEASFIKTLDCGINDQILDMPKIKHDGVNYRFIHFGRLVFFKCTFLIIKALAKTKNPVCLDVIGDGPELAACKQLVNEFGLQDRVQFLDWRTHSELFDSFHDYRGVVLPSIGDSNGIAIQEAMALGLPPICLDWGGPQLLIDHKVNGYLIEPVSEGHITTKMAEYMDALCMDAKLAESFSDASRKKASAWRWSVVAKEWLGHYDKL